MIEETFEIEKDLEEEQEVTPFRFNTISYGADYTVDSIVNRMNTGKIVIPAFQRNYVWSKKQASRFVESLLLGLPVPGIFLAQDPSTSKLIVIDGQQRVESLRRFYDGLFNKKEFELDGVQEDLQGLTYKTLKDNDRNQLDDSILHATVIKSDDDDLNGIYMIFERLNTGGTQLSSQEIRACVNYGEFNDLLSELSQYDSWRVLFAKENPRMKEQELILRFFAFYYAKEQYKKGLKVFLNDFMFNNRNLEKYPKDELKSRFCNTMDIVRNVIGNKAFRLKESAGINAAAFDSIMVGISNYLSKTTSVDEQFIKDGYNSLMRSEEFKQLCSYSTSEESNVRERFNLAILAFDKK